jgi:DNA-binding transcriptional regulator YiaG
MTHIEVKELRNKTGLSQTEFAKKLFKTRDCIAKWESGKFPIPKYAELLINAVFV